MEIASFWRSPSRGCDKFTPKGGGVIPCVFVVRYAAWFGWDKIGPSFIGQRQPNGSIHLTSLCFFFCRKNALLLITSYLSLKRLVQL